MVDLVEEPRTRVYRPGRETAQNRAGAWRVARQTRIMAGMRIYGSRRNAVVLLVLAGCPGSGDETTSAGSTSTGTTDEVEVGTTNDEPTLATTLTTTLATTGDTTDATTGEPPGEDPNVFFVPARQGDQAFVLRVSPAAGVAEPFGPALPVAADDLRNPDVLATPDGSLVTVRCYFEDEVPLATLLVGDGASWQIITKYNKFGLGGNSIAADASLMWFDEIDMPDMPNFQATVINMTGEVIFKGEPLPGDVRLQPEAFGPGGAWFTYRDPQRGLVLRTAAGDEAVLPAEHTHVGFAASVVVTDFTDLQWVDLAAQPIAVPGFVPVDDNVSEGGYQVADSVLSRLADGAVQALQKVPAEWTVDSVYGHAGAFALGRADGVWRTVDGDGVGVGMFVPTPTTNVPDFGELDPWHAVVAGCLDCESGAVVFHAANDLVDGDTSTPFDRSIQMWRLGPLGEDLGMSMIRPWQEVGDSEWGPRNFHFSADGAFLVWTEAAQLRRLEVASTEEAVLAEEFELVQ